MIPESYTSSHRVWTYLNTLMMGWQTDLYLLKRALALDKKDSLPYSLAPDSTNMNERMNTTEIFDGIRYPGYVHTQESLKAACSFQFEDTDIVLVTFPKSGERQAGTRSFPVTCESAMRCRSAFWLESVPAP